MSDEPQAAESPKIESPKSLLARLALWRDRRGPRTPHAFRFRFFCDRQRLLLAASLGRHLHRVYLKKTKHMILRISKWLLPLALLCALAISAHAQNTLTNDKALLNENGYAAVIPGATITVCTASGTGTPCTPTTTVCSSATDATCSSPNPFTADANGNYSFWEPPGTYVVSITAAGVTGYLIKYTIPCSVGTCVGGPGNLTSLNGGTAPASQTYNFATNLDGVKVTTPALSDDSTNAVNSAWVVSYLNTPGNLGTIYPTQIGDSTHPVQIWASAVDIDGPYYFFGATATGSCPTITSPLIGGLLTVGPNGIPQEYNVNAGACQDVPSMGGTPSSYTPGHGICVGATGTYPGLVDCGASPGGIPWPSGAAGIPNYNGSSAWGTTYNASNTIPANFIPTLNQSTTGNAATATNLSSYPALCTGSQFSQGLSSGSNNCGTPAGSAPKLVQKQGTGSGNYTTTNTSFAAVDATNLVYTVVVPSGSKLSILASGIVANTTAGDGTFVGLGSGTCSTILYYVGMASASTTNTSSFSLNWELTGTGASQTIELCYAVSAGSGYIQNTSGTFPVMDFRLEPAN